MDTKTIEQTVIIGAPPAEVYEAILDPKIHSEFTQAKAENDKKEKGKFSAYDGYISGVNLKLDKDKKIVQKWTSNDFPKGHYATVTFEFKKHNKGTELVFTQTDIPEKNCEEVAQGWKDFYWKPLKAFFKMAAGN
jgi:activator of HSP90 ATPase